MRSFGKTTAFLVSVIFTLFGFGLTSTVFAQRDELPPVVDDDRAEDWKNEFIMRIGRGNYGEVKKFDSAHVPMKIGYVPKLTKVRAEAILNAARGKEGAVRVAVFEHMVRIITCQAQYIEDEADQRHWLEDEELEQNRVFKRGVTLKEWYKLEFERLCDNGFKGVCRNYSNCMVYIGQRLETAVYGVTAYQGQHYVGHMSNIYLAEDGGYKAVDVTCPEFNFRDVCDVIYSDDFKISFYEEDRTKYHVITANRDDKYKNMLQVITETGLEIHDFLHIANPNDISSYVTVSENKKEAIVYASSNYKPDGRLRQIRWFKDRYLPAEFGKVLVQYLQAQKFDFEEGIIKLDESILGLRYGCFFDTMWMRSLDLSESSVKRIPTNCFSYCSALKRLKLPPGLEEIEADSFELKHVKDLEIEGFEGTVFAKKAHYLSLNSFKKHQELQKTRGCDSVAGSSNDVIRLSEIKSVLGYYNCIKNSVETTDDGTLVVGKGLKDASNRPRNFIDREYLSVLKALGYDTRKISISPDVVKIKGYTFDKCELELIDFSRCKQLVLEPRIFGVYGRAKTVDLSGLRFGDVECYGTLMRADEIKITDWRLLYKIKREKSFEQKLSLVKVEAEGDGNEEPIGFEDLRNTYEVVDKVLILGKNWGMINGLWNGEGDSDAPDKFLRPSISDEYLEFVLYDLLGEEERSQIDAIKFCRGFNGRICLNLDKFERIRNVDVSELEIGPGPEQATIKLKGNPIHLDMGLEQVGAMSEMKEMCLEVENSEYPSISLLNGNSLGRIVPPDERVPIKRPSCVFALDAGDEIRLKGFNKRDDNLDERLGVRNEKDGGLLVIDIGGKDVNGFLHFISCLCGRDKFDPASPIQGRLYADAVKRIGFEERRRNNERRNNGSLYSSFASKYRPYWGCSEIDFRNCVALRLNPSDLIKGLHAQTIMYFDKSFNLVDQFNFIKSLPSDVEVVISQDTLTNLFRSVSGVKNLRAEIEGAVSIDLERDRRDAIQNLVNKFREILGIRCMIYSEEYFVENEEAIKTMDLGID